MAYKVSNCLLCIFWGHLFFICLIDWGGIIKSNDYIPAVSETISKLETHSCVSGTSFVRKKAPLTYDMWFCCVCCCCCCCCCWISSCCCCRRRAVRSFSKRASISSRTLGVYRTTSLTLSLAALRSSTAFSWCSPSTLWKDSDSS